LAGVREAGPDVQPSRLDLSADPVPVRTGRRFVEQAAVGLGADALLDDIALAAAELLSNAVQHGFAPVTVTVSGGADRIRVEVSDGNRRPPVRPAFSTTNMTGRGLSLVESLSDRWGVELHQDGKTVWAEFTTAATTGARPAPEDVLANWPDDLDEPAGRFTVVLGDVPTELLIAAKAHIDNIVREFTLTATGSAQSPVPAHLAGLIRSVVHEFADARDAIKRQALAAAARGDERTKLTLYLPLSAASAGEAYLAGLDEADAYARAARLLTMEAPPAHRLFRRWYVEAVITQLRAAAAGQPVPPVTSFEQRMLEEIGRLATLQRITDRAARLQRVTAALATSRTPEDVADVVVSEGVAALEASGGSLLLPAADGVHVAVPGVVGYQQSLIDALREELLDAPLPAVTALRTGQAVWLESQEERDREFPALRGFEASTVSMCAVPLIAGDRTVGALRFSFSTRRLFDEDERSFVMALAALTAQTLLRTETYAAERQASVDLQRALLPSETPQIEGWDMAASYSPAGQQEAGGDFYDVFPTGDGRFVAVIGDVMGRGVEAAAAMAQIRTMIRSYAILDPEPATVFEHVDRYFAVSGLEQLVTVLYLLVDPETGSMQVGNAGHLPPVVRTSEGLQLLATAVGTPFGAFGGPRLSTARCLGRGDSFVAFTDGLIERRTEDIDASMLRAQDAISQYAGGTAAQLVDHLASALGSEDAHEDDSTILVLRRV
jgi:serine phosphatase RsbU (regulator of sigma subunit)/anti-sigma regulatory factor (Ser/Thr protein kinase)